MMSGLLAASVPYYTDKVMKCHQCFCRRKLCEKNLIGKI